VYRVRGLPIQKKKRLAREGGGRGDSAPGKSRQLTLVKKGRTRGARKESRPCGTGLPKIRREDLEGAARGVPYSRLKDSL